LDSTFTLAAQGFSVAFTAALVLVPLCIALALKAGVVDKPGGRKQHERVTPLLGGVGVMASVVAGLLVVAWQSGPDAAVDLKLEQLTRALVAAGIMFLIGLVDDVFKDRMAFQLKLLGQVLGVAIILWPRIADLTSGSGETRDWLYILFSLGWYLTIINSFNFSDNMNGLMSGLSIIAFAASVVYLGSRDSLRSMVVSTVLVGSLLGFMPYNFPRSRVFLGDAGSMFTGFWMAWIQLELAKGFPGSASEGDYGFSHLIPAILVMGVPLYDAAFVVFMRIMDRRPIYLGDNHHLSHRLVRAGFTPVEAVVILWGLGSFLAGIGVIAAFSLPSYRYLLLLANLLLMIAVTRVIMRFERRGSLVTAPRP
jgi:UDP-GlcNAc:undecaprenyl-phosphate/decaprenyl-phosphate GlcNAc-1-phosphate transferase